MVMFTFSVLDLSLQVSLYLNLLTWNQWLFLFLAIAYTIIYTITLRHVSSKNEGADLVKTAQLFYFHFVPTV